MQSLFSQHALRELGARVHDVWNIVEGGGDNAKFRFGLSIDKCMVRCAQGHSAGSGVRPDCLPVAKDVQFLIHGTSLEAAKKKTQTGLSRRQRLRVHFYECDRAGNAMGGNSVRCGSDLWVVISAHHCVGDGFVFTDPQTM